VLAYITTGSRLLNGPALRDLDASFVDWHELDGSLSEAEASAEVRGQCLRATQKKYAFVGFLKANEYIIVRGRARGKLDEALAHRDLRNAPGMDLPPHCH
jgi:hypothetical protein